MKLKTASDLLGKRLLFITAHPDDESFLASGTIYKNYQAGGTSAIICATYGEKGKGHLEKPVTPLRLKQIRKKELNQVSKFLKVKKLYHLNLPDGELVKVAAQLKDKILTCIRQWQPEIIIGFGPDGISGHQDHICIGKISRKLAKKLKIPFLMFTAGPVVTQQFSVVMRRRSHGVYAKTTKHIPHSIAINVNPKIKQKALLMHKSQKPFAHFNKSIIREILHFDFFRQ